MRSLLLPWIIVLFACEHRAPVVTTASDASTMVTELVMEMDGPKQGSVVLRAHAAMFTDFPGRGGRGLLQGVHATCSSLGEEGEMSVEAREAEIKADGAIVFREATLSSSYPLNMHAIAKWISFSSSGDIQAKSVRARLEAR